MMTLNLENAAQVVRALAKNRMGLYEAEVRHRGDGSVEARLHYSEAAELMNVVRILTDERWLNELADIYGVAR